MHVERTLRDARTNAETGADSLVPPPKENYPYQPNLVEEAPRKLLQTPNNILKSDFHTVAFSLESILSSRFFRGTSTMPDSKKPRKSGKADKQAGPVISTSNPRFAYDHQAVVINANS